MTTMTKCPIAGAGKIHLLTRMEVAAFLRISARTVEEQSKRWETTNSSVEVTTPSSPRLGLRPTRVTAKMLLYDYRDINEYLANARREQEGQTAIKLLEFEE